jgi:NAD+ kinase
MRKIGIVSRCDRPDVIEMVKNLIGYLEKKAEILLDNRTAQELKASGKPIGEMREEGAELVISIGGDGTALRAIQKMEDPLPILGINMGTIGFLVDVNPKDAFSTIDKIFESYEVEERSRLAVTLNQEHLPPATNEVVIITAHPAKILSYKIYVDQNELEELRADGIVVATPTGSTAYAMSAGGPMIDPRVDATVVVPLAPFKLSARPWVVPASSEIRVELLFPKKEALVVIDGQYTRKITEADRITITKAEKPARFIKTRRNGFYEKVRIKLA